MTSSQLTFPKSEINRFWSTFFQFYFNIIDLDFSESAKQSSIIVISGRWWETVDIKLSDIMVELKLHYRKCYRSKLKTNWKFLLVAIWERIQNWIRVCQQNNMLIDNWYVKITKKKNFLWVFLIKLFSNDSIISLVKLFTCRDGFL